MNEILLLVLTWLPVLAESGLFVIVGKFLSKQLKEHFSLPKRIVEESKELKREISSLNQKLASLAGENAGLKEEIHKLILEMRGIKANESVKKN